MRVIIEIVFSVIIGNQACKIKKVTIVKVNIGLSSLEDFTWKLSKR